MRIASVWMWMVTLLFIGLQYNPTDAAKYAEAISDYYDKHYAFCGTPIRRTQWEHFLEKD